MSFEPIVSNPLSDEIGPETEYMKMNIEGEKAKIYVIQKTNDAVLTQLFKA